MRYGHLSDAEIAQLFWSKVDRSDVSDACWEWQGRRTAFGHGHAYSPSRRRAVGAHRMAYELTFGTIPPGLVIRHKCDNPPCCNPGHLEPGTRADNNRDTVSRGRRKVSGQGQFVRPVRKHRTSVRCVLSRLIARRNMERAERGERPLSQAQIARASGVPQSVISTLVNDKTRRIDFDTINGLCNFFNVAPGDLFDHAPDE